MGNRSQEQCRLDERRIFRAGLAWSIFSVFSIFCAGTMGGALADDFDDLMTQDDKSGIKRDPTIDDQSKDDFKKREEHEISALRRLREKAAIEAKEQQNTRSLYDRFDGSEFKKQTFIDTDFRKQSYTDLSKRKKDTRPDDGGARTKDLFAKTDDERLLDSDSRGKDKRDLRERDRDLKVWKDLTKPIPYMLNDWVPQKADPIHNGGFVKEPDNGHPVPYHLNGHPDFQRKLPWAD
jgi:hypothetical protein